MTTETRKRIRAYKKMLPELRERVIAVALLLAMSASMLGSASFAWITLSRSPEVSGMSTTVAANGNLEIALAEGTVSEGKNPPLESQVGDSSSTERENWGITNANVTWGNLVNLSDPKYGLDKIALRPALLSSYGLDRSPLHGASYGKDGRVIDTVQQYEYASLMDIGDGDYQFTAGNNVQYGVRAVSSMRTENTVGGRRLAKFESDTNKYYGEAVARYNALVSDGKSGSVTATVFHDKTAVKALQGMVSTFAQNKVDDGDSSYANYVWYLHQMMIELRAIMLEHEALGLLELANWQAYVYNKNTNDKTFGSFDQLLEYKDSLSSYGVKLTTLDSFQSDLQILNECITGMQSMADSCDPETGTFPDIKWGAIEPYINKMVNLSTATLEVPGKLAETRVYSIGMSVATSLLNVDNALIRIYDGVIKNFEDRTGARMEADVTVTVKYIITVPVGGTVFTTSTSTNYAKDVVYATSMDNSGAAGEKYAKDTYGMAIDVWVRTNAPESILTLEGTTMYEYTDVTFQDDENNTITVYEMRVTQDGDVAVYEVYQSPEDDQWYYRNDDTLVPEANIRDISNTPKQTKKVIGFRGENRIWEDWETLLEYGYIAEDATTQGAGSCFVFYADNPTEQAKLLEMMNAFTITFIDINGEEVATAILDTENAYINQGKITAPLAIKSGVTYVDEDDNQKMGIMALEQNKATWLTALIYLDGTLLQNDNVLATSSIVGQLNLQFGNNVQMDVREDDELQMQHRSITAEAVSMEDSTKVSTNIEDVIEYEYDVNGHEVKVNLTVDGDQPERISGFFVRVINETQGTRTDTVNFTKNEDGTWSGVFKLTAPGTYVMNSLMADGVEYNLRTKTQADKGNHPSVVINGLNLESVRTSHLNGTYMTDDESIQVAVYAKIEADEALNPKAVWAQYFSEDGSKQYNGQLKFNPNNDGGTWEGTVSLNSSGTYILRYLTIDGIPVEVSPGSQNRLVCYMGLKCTVYGPEEREYLYKGQPFHLAMSAVVQDDTNEPMTDLENVHLYYHSDGSSDDDQGMHAPLTWDEDIQRYTGTFELNTPGRYVFNRLGIGGGNELMTARSAPVFTASTPVPPSWSDGSAVAEARQLGFDSSNPATLSLRLKDAASATVWAELEQLTQNADGSYTVSGDPIRVQQNTKTTVYNADNEDTGMRDFGFVLNQEGIWRLKRVLCQGVYNGTTGYPVGGTTYYEVDVPAEDQVVTEVITTIHSELFYNGEKKQLSFTEKFGVDAQGNKTGVIFTAYNPSVAVTITDYKGANFPELKDVTWNITHSATNMNSYGGYTGNNYGQMQPQAMTWDATEKKYVSPTVTMDLAGDYATTVTAVFNINGKEYEYPLPVKPTFQVHNVKPTVTVSAVTPTTANMPTKISWAKSGGWGSYRLEYTLSENKTNGYDTQNSVWNVYPRAATSGVENVGNGDAGFERPTIKFDVQNVDSKCTVKFTIPAGSASAINFSQTGNGVSNPITLGTTKEVYSFRGQGIYVLYTYSVRGYSGHGNITISTVSIEREGKTYSVTLDTPIKIYNPSSVDKTS